MTRLLNVNFALAAAVIAFLWGLTCGYASADVCSPGWLTSQAKNANGTTTGWTGVCSTDPRDGGGGFIQFLSPNKANTFLSGITFNGGLMIATPGKEQGDLDIGIIVNGGYGTTMSFFGNPDGSGPVMAPSVTGVFKIGLPTNTIDSFYMSKYSCPQSLVRAVPEPDHCIKVDDGYTPVYK